MMAVVTPITPTTPPRRGRGRRPLAEVRTDVLDAAATVLLAEGVPGFTVEKVVATSGVSSATVYKYWPSRGALALDGYVHAVGESADLPDTGDIRSDLIDMLRSFVDLVTRTPLGPVLGQLIGAAQIDVELARQFDSHYFGPRRRQGYALLEAAKERGQIRDDVDPGLLIDLMWGACYIRLLLPNITEQLSVDFVHQVVDQALVGALIGSADGAGRSAP